jgi:transcription elongation factor GreA
MGGMSSTQGLKASGHHPNLRDGARNGHAAQPLLMTPAGLEELQRKLERLAGHGRAELAQGLRDARAYGNDANNDEHHALQEERVILEARIALLEDTRARALVVDPSTAPEGVAAIGSTVTIEDLASGRQSRYWLGSSNGSFEHDVISAASPMGHALIGAATGSVVTVDLPNGRSRSVRLVTTETSENS